MYFSILNVDKPNSLELRMATRPKHLEYLEANIARIFVGGAHLADDLQTPTASLLIVDVKDRAEAEAFAAADPYAQAGLFQSVTITPWRRVFPKA
jgi:uncharacterized protein YciI